MTISKAVRDLLLVQARHRCTICLETCFEVHHIVEQAEGGGDEPANLIVLCPNCHQHRVHRSKEITREQLREYKRRLGDGAEMEKRLLLNLAEIHSRVADVTALPTEAPHVADANDERDTVAALAPAISAIMSEMIGTRDPCSVFEIDVPGWEPSVQIGNGSIAEIYVRVFELDSPNARFVAVIIERCSEDVSKLDEHKLHKVARGHWALDYDEEVLDCLGPFRTQAEAEARALAWQPPPNER